MISSRRQQLMIIYIFPIEIDSVQNNAITSACIKDDIPRNSRLLLWCLWPRAQPHCSG